MSFRSVFFSIALVISLLTVFHEPALAQDDASQRMLPLPQKDLPNLEHQLELLKRLRSLIESRLPQDSATIPDPSKSTPSVDPQQLEQMRNALKSLQEKLPPGFVPPDLSSVPPEQLRKAIENPAVQQQMRDMLQQFSKDGVLPSPRANGGTALPMPKRPPTDNSSGPRKNSDTSILPPASMESLQDFLKKLTENPAPNPTVENPSATEPRPTKPLRRKEYGTSPVRPGPNDLPPSIPVPEPPPPGANRPSPDSPLPPYSGRRPLPNPKRTNPGTTRPEATTPQKSNPAGEPSPDSSSVPREIDHDNSEAQQRTLEALKGVMDEIAEQMQQESRSSTVPDATPDSGVSPLDEINNRTPQATLPPSQSSRSGSRMPSISEFIQEQLKDLKRSPEKGSTGPDSPSDRNAALPPQNPSGSNPPERPNQATQPNSVAQSPAPEMTSPQKRASPPIDIQKELERSGFGGTLKKIVEKARNESRERQLSGNDSTASGETGSADSQASPGLEQSMIRMLDGMKDDLAEIAKESRFKEPVRRSEPRQQTPPRSREVTSPDSTLNQIRKAASSLFSGPTDSVQKKTSSAGSSSVPDTPTLDTQFALAPVAVAATLIAAFAAVFFGLQFVKRRAADAASAGRTPAPIAPSEIRDRADVIRAFHEFAMRSTKSVQTWWTHQAVERVLITAAPEKKAAVETLTSAYEQARYLPEDLELSSEQIQLAQKALRQCANSAPA